MRVNFVCLWVRSLWQVWIGFGANKFVKRWSGVWTVHLAARLTASHAETFPSWFFKNLSDLVYFIVSRA